MNTTWKFYDGIQENVFTTFPFAYRALFNLVKKNLDSGKTVREITRKYKIISPVKREYSYDNATQLALEQGLLNKDGTLNSKEFKRKL